MVVGKVSWVFRINQHPLGLGSLFSWSPGFCYGTLPAPPYNEIFSRLEAAAVMHPESLRTFVIRCPESGREWTRPSEPCPHPTVLLPTSQ